MFEWAIIINENSALKRVCKSVCVRLLAHSNIESIEEIRVDLNNTLQAMNNGKIYKTAKQKAQENLYRAYLN